MNILKTSAEKEISMAIKERVRMDKAFNRQLQNADEMAREEYERRLEARRRFEALHKEDVDENEPESPSEDKETIKKKLFYNDIHRYPFNGGKNTARFRY